MIISFIISSQVREDKLFKTINTLKKQTNDDYELIIVADDTSAGKEALDFLRDQFKENEKISVIFNSKGQGNALNWNNGMQIANGEYVMFLKEGDLVEPNFVEEINKIIDQEKNKLDIIEVQFEKTDLIQGVTPLILAPNRVYNLLTDIDVFAYITQEIYGKLFRNKFIKDFRIQFKKTARFDLLFLFMALAHCKTFYLSDLVLFKHRMSKPKYSIFDIINQWPHILNYYRRIGIYKEYKDELSFAYNYGLCYLYLNLAKEINNELIYKKSLNSVASKTSRKLKDFINSNQRLDANLTPEFYERIIHFDAFVKNELAKKLG